MHTNMCVSLHIYKHIYIHTYIHTCIKHIKISKVQTKSPCCLMLEYFTHKIASISGFVQDMGSAIVVGACGTPS